MQTSTQPLPADEFDSLLERARQALRNGNASKARHLIKEALLMAQSADDVRQQAQAHLCMANADRMVSRFKRSSESSQRAVFLFQLCGDRLGEAEALAALAFAHAVLGRTYEAVETALLSVKLNESSASEASLANSYNYLGLAYTYSWDFDKANEAFEKALEIYERLERWVDAYVPRMNQRSMELYRTFFDRYYNGQMSGLARLAKLSDALGPADSEAHTVSIFQGAFVRSAANLLLQTAMEQCWLGHAEMAQGMLDKAVAVAARFERNPTILIATAWVRAEISWFRKEWSQAQEQAGMMIDLATQVGNEHLVTIGYLLASQIYKAQGKEALAFDALKLMMRRQQMLRNEASISREDVVDWQLKVRSGHENLQRLESEARQFEKLSFEDVLTGLANRRRFAQHLPEMLRRGFERAEPPLVAFIDIDKFKGINDRYSHQVGDEVLKHIALILKNFVRAGDLPARIAGDEFVIAFSGMDSETMEQLCNRISTAVSQFDWSQIHDGLQVNVSIGIARAQNGDTVESLLHRSDTAMYLEKREASRRA